MFTYFYNGINVNVQHILLDSSSSGKKTACIAVYLRNSPTTVCIVNNFLNEILIKRSVLLIQTGEYRRENGERNNRNSSELCVQKLYVRAKARARARKRTYFAQFATQNASNKIF